MSHKSVLLKESLQILEPRSDGIYLDLTFGGGGHCEAILQQSSPNGIVVAFDTDADAINRALELKKIYNERLIVVQENFAKCYSRARQMGYTSFDGIIMDIGVSSFQLNEAQRGFSFLKEGPLDMRMNTDNPLTAEIIVNQWNKYELENIISYYGEERFAKKIARKIDEKRKKIPIKTTFELASIIKEAVPTYFYTKIHPATKTFQALRIVVNSELENLKEGLLNAIKLLNVNAHLVVISFHSLEDRVVKTVFKDLAAQNMVLILNKKPIVPSLEEIGVNPRSRSAKLRSIKKGGGIL